MTRKTIGKGRHTSITMYEVDARSIFDGKTRPPVSVTHYKPTREQHFTALGRMYGVTRTPDQSLRSFIREVEKAIAEAMARHNGGGK